VLHLEPPPPPPRHDPPHLEPLPQAPSLTTRPVRLPHVHPGL